MTDAGKALLDAISRHQPEVWDDEERRNAIAAIEDEAVRDWLASEKVERALSRAKAGWASGGIPVHAMLDALRKAAGE